MERKYRALEQRSWIRKVLLNKRQANYTRFINMTLIKLKVPNNGR